MNPIARLPATDRLSGLRQEVLAGLAAQPRTLPTRLLYDAEGTRLFEAITRLPEYYLTRTELGILRECLSEVAALVGAQVRVVEPGSGNGEKASLLLAALDRPSAYLPVEIAPDPLEALAGRLRKEFPDVELLPVVADYTRDFDLPIPETPFRRTLVFFPGSTIGNFGPEEAKGFLAGLRRTAGSQGALLLGADLEKPRHIVEPAYDDADGVTAAFNRNLLLHLNRLLDTDFDPEGFDHRAPWVEAEGRIEMRLLSRRDQVVRIPVPRGEEDEEAGFHEIALPKGEAIVTEHSYKYAPEALDRLVEDAGWRPWREWRDPAGWYSVRLLRSTLSA